jgi:carnitine O-acetyltransferase
LALQVAWRRLYTEPTAIYESASTRAFLHGRTETGRSLTTDTWNFAKSFDDPTVSADEKKQLFTKAVKSQSNYLKEAAQGKGVDRHLLGLRVQIQSEETPKATLFTDPAYIQSMYFKLSTSNIGTGERLWGGFGPVVPEGYGVNYAIGSDNFKFSISSKRSCKDTDSNKFRDALLGALRDMRKLFE